MTDLQNALEQLQDSVVACLLPREAKALLEEREALRRALEVFAKYLPHDSRIASKPDHPIIVRLKDIKAACAVLKGKA